MKILIVVDMQNDFIDGSLANPAAQKIIPEMVGFIKQFNKVIFTRDTHEVNYLETAEGKSLPIKHCIRKTDGWNIRRELEDAALDSPNMKYIGYIDKPTFGYMDWKLNLNYDDEIVMVGTCTDICVISNALILKAKYPENKITVVGHLCAGLTEEKHKAALNVMRSCQIEVLD